MAYPSGYRPGGYGNNKYGLQPYFYERLSALIRASGGRVWTYAGAGFRTIEGSNRRRKELAGTGIPVAAGGNSWHNYGVAVDLDQSSDLALAAKLAPRFGLYFPMGNEPWHIQPIEARGGSRSGKPIPRLGYKGVYNNAKALPKNPYAALVDSASTKYGVPRGLLNALLYFESSYNPKAGSSAGAQGIAQFMPGTWRGAWNPFRGQSPLDPTYAISASAIYLKNLYRAYGSWKRALSAYNSGRPDAYNPASRGAIRETVNYVNKILPYLNSDEGYEDNTPDYNQDGTTNEADFLKELLERGTSKNRRTTALKPVYTPPQGKPLVKPEEDENYILDQKDYILGST